MEVLLLLPENFAVPEETIGNPWSYHRFSASKKLVLSKGFRDGSHVFVKADGASFVITSIDDRGFVALKPVGGNEKGQLLKLEGKNFLASFEISEKFATFDYPNQDIPRFAMFKTMRAETIIALGMIEYYESYSPVSGITVQEKPKTIVKVVNEFAKRKLLIPMFGIVSHGPLEEGVPDGAFEVKNANVDDRVFWIKQHVHDQDGVVGVAPSNYVSFSKQLDQVRTIQHHAAAPGRSRLRVSSTTRA